MDEDILQEFLAESWENLGRLDSEIVSLEKNPKSTDLLASIFRTIHTIKGTCGFIGLTRLGSVAHSAENVLGQMRDGVLEVTPNAISLVLQAVDVIKELLQGLEATREEPTRDNSVLISKLDALAGMGGHAANEPSHEAPAAVPSTSQSSATGTPIEAVASVASVSPTPEKTSAAPMQPEQPRPVSQIESGSDTPQETLDASMAKEESLGDQGGKKSVADLSIRVNVLVLDSLMNLVGELVLTRNQLLQLARGDDESKYAAPITHLNRVTTDLQEGVMKTRMQPIGNAWSKLPRLVRDLSQITGKQIELEMAGAETELDRTVLDAIKDPLTHMVRNSADHGIELPAARHAAGKPEIGKIRLNAYHEGGHVIICISDDGAGINKERVLRKAIQQGLVSEADSSKLSESEILKFIFNPGFSTAEQVSSVSGRGVGMDVVRTSIERIGGTIDLTSVPGSGTTVRIKIPLTLAIISALVVESGRESFAIPQLGVVELVRLAAEDLDKIERIHENEVFRLRDRLLPLVHLDSALGLSNKEDHDGDVNIVVVQVGEEQFGLIVSEVFDTEEIVVKPVGSLLKGINIYQGTTILGDGRVIMILDVAGIASKFGGMHSNTKEDKKAADTDIDGRTTSLLLFDAGDGTTMAVPLSLVARLEEFPRNSIERSGDKLVVQYRGDLLPLQPVQGFSVSNSGPEPQPVIVFSEGRRSMGLMVNEIQDIIEERLIIRMQSQRKGVLGTAIINGHATDIIDTNYYVTQINPNWFSRGRERRESRRVLVVDDSLFFRQLVTTALESQNYRVALAESAVEAIERIEHGERYDVIISDIEMPKMDGIEFARRLRARADLQSVPLIAMSSLSAAAFESRALQTGFNRCLTKFNAQQLLDTIEEFCGVNAESRIGVSA